MKEFFEKVDFEKIKGAGKNSTGGQELNMNEQLYSTAFAQFLVLPRSVKIQFKPPEGPFSKSTMIIWASTLRKPDFVACEYPQSLISAFVIRYLEAIAVNLAL